MKKTKLVLGLTVLVGMVLLGIYQNYLGYLRFGKSFNPTRAELGVPLIEESFLQSDNLKMWYTKQENYPRHDMKLLSIKGLSLDIEQDNFEFVKDSVVVTASCYYHYDENCYNIYLSEGGYNKKISCEALVKLLAEQGLSVKLKCNECSNNK